MVTLIRTGGANSFLVEGSNGSILVDVGDATSAEKLVNLVRYKKVRLVVLTHGHADHCAAAAAVHFLLKTPVAMGEGDLELIETPAARKLYGYSSLGKMLAKSSDKTLPKTKLTPFYPEITLTDGMRLDKYGVAASVVALAGHTAGSFGVLTDEGEFIVGDAAFNIFRPTPPLTAEDLQMARATYDRILASGAKTLYVGHGRPIKPK